MSYIGRTDFGTRLSTAKSWNFALVNWNKNWKSTVGRSKMNFWTCSREKWQSSIFKSKNQNPKVMSGSWWSKNWWRSWKSWGELMGILNAWGQDLKVQYDCLLLEMNSLKRQTSGSKETFSGVCEVEAGHGSADRRKRGSLKVKVKLGRMKAPKLENTMMPWLLQLLSWTPEEPGKQEGPSYSKRWTLTSSRYTVIQ